MLHGGRNHQLSKCQITLSRGDMQICALLGGAIEVIPSLELKTRGSRKLFQSIVKISSNIKQSTIASDRVDALIVVVFSQVIMEIEVVAFDVRIAPAIGQAEVAVIDELCAEFREKRYLGLCSSRSYSSSEICTIPFSSSGSICINLRELAFLNGVYS